MVLKYVKKQKRRFGAMLKDRMQLILCIYPLPPPLPFPQKNRIVRLNFCTYSAAY